MFTVIAKGLSNRRFIERGQALDYCDVLRAQGWMASELNVIDSSFPTKRVRPLAGLVLAEEKIVNTPAWRSRTQGRWESRNFGMHYVAATNNNLISCNRLVADPFWDGECDWA